MQEDTHDTQHLAVLVVPGLGEEAGIRKEKPDDVEVADRNMQDRADAPAQFVDCWGDAEGGCSVECRLVLASGWIHEEGNYPAESRDQPPWVQVEYGSGVRDGNHPAQRAEAVHL